MKRVLSFILALTMTLTLCACGSGSGKMRPYLNGLQFGASEAATEKAMLELEKNEIIDVNGIGFNWVSAEYNDGKTYSIQYKVDDLIGLSSAICSSTYNPLLNDIAACARAEKSISEFMEKYAQAYAILEKSFGEADEESSVQELLTFQDFAKEKASKDYYAIWYYNDYIITLKVKSNVYTTVDGPGKNGYSWYHSVLTGLTLTIEDSCVD